MFFHYPFFLKAAKSMKWAGNGKCLLSLMSHLSIVTSQPISFFAAAPGWLGISHMTYMGPDWLKICAYEQKL